MAATLKLRGYTVERLLGSGGSGEVWQARVSSSGAPVALKRIPASSAAQRDRARAEAALLSALDHPNLVRLHSMIPAPDALVLVLDLADGGSLAQLLAARGRLAPGEVITAIAPVAAALAYLHGEGVVHGDVSAGNILFSREGVPLLADVGVARLTGDDTDVEATPAYVDPAVAAGCIPGPPSDVFMLAGVALHALTGAPPWPAADGAQALALAARGVLDDVPERLAASGIAPEMAAVLTRALHVDPHRRGTAADLALDLRHSGRPLAVELAAGGPQPEPAVRSGPRHAARPVDPPGRYPDDPEAAAADRSRPPFTRPGELSPGGAEPPTRLVGPRPRPVIPRPRRRRPVAPLVVAAVAAVAMIAGGAMWLRTADAGSEATQRAQPRAEVETEGARATRQPSTAAAPRAAGAGGDRPRASGPTARPRGLVILDGLDAVRAQAFARRDPQLLRRVYLPGPLLDADTALLTRLVPPGCILTGVRTRFAGVRAEGHGGRIRITATASLPPSQLVCAGKVRATAPGAGPTGLRVELVQTRDGPRIAEQVLQSG